MVNRMFDFTWKSAWRGVTGITVVLALIGFGAADTAAQNTGTVTGLVLDNTVQIPLAGAQMTVDGTPIGGLVNNTGRYLLLNVPAGEQSITAQIIGYSTVTVTVTVTAGETVTADFNLRQEAVSLEGVIVTGTAGAARRKEIGNAISSITAADIQVATVTDFGDILQGRISGVQINDHGGQVGSGSQIRIRGNNSLTQGNDPLIYIDGVRMESGQIGSSDEAAQEPNVFDMINPNDIDRIEIVKGPAATTLYGTEAAGGVIQIFTKRGSAGAPAWSLSVDQGTSIMPHAGPTGLGSTYDERYPLPGGWLLPADEVINPFGLNLNDCSSPRAWAPNGEPGCPENGSWFAPGYRQDYNLSVRGGGETATYFVAGRYGNEIGTIQVPEEYDPQGAEDYSVRGNIQFTPFDGMQISLNNSYARRVITWIPNGNNASGLFLNVIRGPAGYTPGNDDSLVLENDINQTIDHVVSSVSVGWTPNNMFSHRLNVGMDYTISDFVDFKAWGYYEEFQGDRESDTQTDRNLTFDYNG
ncbi:MAG: TonB-dependent receptor plug domain-containing protein, partial [Gemmatimonadetes bacterium]|nr:TonB-dependent receptor plug domain-containing protein [Gemmatimonadota bacterium]